MSEFKLQVVLDVHEPGRQLHVELQCPGRTLQAGFVAWMSFTGLIAAILTRLS